MYKYVFKTFSFPWDIYPEEKLLAYGNSIFNYLSFSYSLPQQLTQVQSFGQDDPLEEGMVAHTSILAWRIPWTKEPGRLQSIGLQRVWYD